MKNAAEFVASIHGNFLAHMAPKGINKQKQLDPDQQEFVLSVMSAMKVKELQEHPENHEKTLLAMRFVTFVNTL
jgi:hypothetical protein